MALAQASTAFGALQAWRQMAFMVVMAGAVALGVAIIMWASEPSYTLLYGNLSDKDSAEVLQALQQNNIPYKLESGSGAVLVPTESVHEARLKLASQGLPGGAGVGFEILQKERELGASQFIELARYQRALETELARSIASIKSVQNARVHLAIPKRSVFLRKSQKPSASVVLDLYSGRSVEEENVAAIVHLVAGSIPELSPEQVTVVDASGRLLTRQLGDKNMALTTSQFEYTRKLEQSYAQRIEDLITPIMGQGRVRAQVGAEVDFTMTESTSEVYNPDLPALRSEQVKEQRSVGAAGAVGIPGALSNQPPPAGTTDPAAADTGSAEGAPRNTQTAATRNYELDKTISHVRAPAGRIKRLAVAVVVDDRQRINDEGEVVREALSDEEINNISALVKEAVAFDAKRGDTINVINSSFYIPEEPEALPEPSIFEAAWMQNLIKYVLGGIGMLLLIFVVIRPILKSLTEKGARMPAMQQMAFPDGQQLSPDQLSLGQGQQPRQLGGPKNYEEQLQVASQMASSDPGRVAQVVRGWVNTDG